MKIVKKIKNMFSSGNTAVVNDAPSLSQEERVRRIKLAADITVQKYGDVIARLARE